MTEQEPERRLLVITWQTGEPLAVDLDGTWDRWEVAAALQAALDVLYEGDEEQEEADDA